MTTWRNSLVYQTIEVRLPWAGKTRVEVRWPRLCPAPAGGAVPNDVHILPPLELDVVGRVEVVPGELSYVGESVVVRAALAPGTLPPGESLRLRARNRDNKDAEVIDLELRDDGKTDSGDEQAGDGVYSMRYAFVEAGNYEIMLPSSKAVRLQPGLARVGFDFKQRITSGEMLYGGGTLSQVLLAPVPGLNLETLSMPDVIEVENKLSGPCQFRAVMRYPAKLHDSHSLSQRDLDRIELSGFNDEQHLKGALLYTECQGQMEETTNPAELGGTLQPGGKLVLGVLCELSEDAIKRLYDGDGNHATLGHANGLVVELHLKWDEEGSVIERVLRVPISVRTRSWRVHGIVISIVFLLLAFSAYLVYRRWLANYIWPLSPAGERHGARSFSFIMGLFGKHRKSMERPRSKKEPQVEPFPEPTPPEESPLQPPDY